MLHRIHVMTQLTRRIIIIIIIKTQADVLYDVIPSCIKVFVNKHGLQLTNVSLPMSNELGAALIHFCKVVFNLKIYQDISVPHL